MTTEDHTSYQEDVGAYLLGALSEGERQAFESHAAGCEHCREEVERLRPAVHMLPGTVEQVEPPPGLKRSLMEVVEREAREASSEHAPAPPVAVPVRAERPGRALGERLRELLRPVRPGWALAAVALALVVGLGAAQLLGGGGDTRTVLAQVDESRIAGAAASLTVAGDGRDGATLKVERMPTPRSGQVYQAWIMRDGNVEPQPTFEVGRDGAGAVAVPADLRGAEAVLVTRERRGGATTPSEDPVLSVQL